jgi:signal transduction histidine kinase
MVPQSINDRALSTLRPLRRAGHKTRIIQAFMLMLLCSAATAVLEAKEPYRVLVLHSFRSSLPVTSDWYAGIVRGFASAPDLHVEIDSESPNLARLINTDSTQIADKGRLTWLLDFYRKNYQDRKPHLIIPTDTPALRFLLIHGEELFPEVPIVFADADPDFVSAQKLPPNITGVTGFLDISGTLELALRLQPDTQRVAVIVGSAQYDKAMERAAQPAIESFADRVEFVWLRGMPVDELVEALNALPERTVALYLVQTQDITGNPHVPRAILKRFSAAAKVPVYGLWDTLLEHGIVGGRLATVEEDGYQAAKLAVRILRGEAPATLPIVDRLVNPIILDGVELARWNIKENRLPEGSQIRHRHASILDEHRTEIIATLAIIVMQGVLIVALILSRRRLRQAQTELHEENDRRGEAETMAARLRERIARFSRQRSLGTMATTIAHEINQPLIAIQNYAQAAKRRIQTDVDDKPRLIDLFAKIEGQAERAGAITQRVRSLVNSSEPQLSRSFLSPLIEEVIGMMELECETHGCRLVSESAVDLPPVFADTLQVQLVLVNLLHNAIQSFSASDESDKLISVEVCQLDDQELQVSVIDRGSGVPPERVNSIFEPLYSDTSTGMGMGLAICRDIMEAHGGRIWCEPNPAGGAIFRFTLRIADS